MKKRPSITLLTVLLAMVFAAGIGVYSSYIGMKIYQESSDHLLESFSQISETFTLFVQRNWTVLSQWDGLLKNADIAHADSIGADMQANKESWHYSDFYLFNESTQYLTADGRRGSADSISGVIQEMYSEGGPIVSTYTASYGVPKIAFAMPLSRNMTLDGVTYTGLAVSYDTDVVDDLVDGSMYDGKSDCYIVRTNGDIVLALEPQTELCEGMTNLYDIDAHADWIYGTMDDIRDCVQLGRSGSAQFICQGGRNYLVAIPTAFPDWTLVGIIRADEVDGAMRSVQQSTIIALGALCIFAVIIVVLALGMESQLRLRREEAERLSLEREKMQSDRLLQSMSRIVDRYSIVNLDTDRYRYRELRNSEPLYPSSGRYSDMVETISRRYVALTETENAKLSRLITPEYLRSVLRKPDDNLKIEYCSRTENAYMVLTYIRLEGLNERNDRFGLQAGDEAVIAAARCVSDFCRECEDEGESVLCFRTGGNEFALIRPEPHIDSGQLHRQFRAVVARYNRTCAPRARITMTFGFSRLCDEDGKSRSISAWKAEADAHLKKNEARLGGDAE